MKYKMIRFVIMQYLFLGASFAQAAYHFPPSSLVIATTGFRQAERAHFKVSCEGGAFYVEHHQEKRQLQDCFVDAILKKIDPRRLAEFVEKGGKLKVINSHDDWFALEVMGSVKGGFVFEIGTLFGFVCSIEIGTPLLLAACNAILGIKDRLFLNTAQECARRYDEAGGVNGGGCGNTTPSPTETPLVDETPEHMRSLGDIASPAWRGGAAWDDKIPYRGEIRTNGKSGKKKRYYTPDRVHDREMEEWDRRGRHLGALDSETGERIKPADKDKDLDI